MNLTWHIVKKDLRALRWPLGLWLLCIAAKLGVGVLLLNATGEEGAAWFQQMDLMARGLAAAEVLSFVLVAALIQEDLMVGTTAFWMTRPISGARLLRAKLLSIGLVFLLAPVLVTLPWWLGCNYGTGEIAWAAAETVAVHAIVVLAALLWSAVTDGLGRFLMWTLVTLTVTPMATAILGYYLRRGHRIMPEVISTRFLVALAIVTAGVLVVLVHQYLTRHTWRSVAVIGATMSLAVLTLAFWPWAWNVESRVYGYLIQRAQGSWPTASEPPGLKFTLASADFSVRRDRPERPGALVTKYQVEGLDASQGFMAYVSGHSWHWPDGSIAKGYSMAGQSMLNGLASTKAAEFMGEPATAAREAVALSLTSFLPVTTMAKVRAQPPALNLQARLRLMKHKSTTPLPARAGAWQVDGVVGERVAGVEKSGEQLLVTFISHAPSLWVDVVAGGQLAPFGDFSRYFLINRIKPFVDSGSTTDKKQTRVGTVSITWQTLAFRASRTGGSPTKPLLEAINALDDAELVKVTFAEQARFTHEFEIDPARIAQAQP